MFNASSEMLENNRVKLSVTVDAEKVDAAVKKAYQNLAKEVRIPGFRPGKAPRKMIEQVVGSDYALTDAAEHVINDIYPLALDAEKLRPVGAPEFADPADLEEGKEFEFVVTVEVRPELTLTDTTVEVAMPPRETTEAEIDEQVEATRERMAGLQPAEDREIKADDFLTISFKSTLDGEEYEGSSVDHTIYELGKGQMPEEFEAAIVGAKPGDTVTAEFKVENTGANEEFAGKTIHFDIEIHDIKDKVLPELNDEFATMVGFETIAEMREEIRTYISSQKEQSYDRILDERIIAALAEKLEGEVPDAVLMSRRDALKSDLARMLEERKITLESYLEMVQISEEQYDIDLMMQASIEVSGDLALEALARKEDLFPTEEEFDAEFEKVGQATGMSKDEAKARWAEYGLMTSLADDMARAKALEWLRENATITIDESAR